jgi:hypothetical protein
MSRRILSLIVCLSATATAEDVWHYVEPTAKIMIGIQWRRLFQSPLGSRFSDRLQEGLALPTLQGMASLQDIDMVLFSSRGTPPEGQKHVPALTIVAGHFDLNKIRTVITKRSKRMVAQSVEIYSGADRNGSPLAIGLVSPELLLIGDLSMIVRAVGAPTGRSSLMLARAKQMNQSNAFWVLTSIPPSEDTVAANLPVPFPIEQVKTLEMGFSVEDGVGMEVNVQMISDEAAQKFKGDLEKTIRLASKDKNVPPDLKGIEKNLKIGAELEFVRMSFRLEGVDLDRRLQAFAARSATGARTVAAAVPEPPPSNAKPVIWNLDPQPF